MPAQHEKPRAVEHMFDRLLWPKLHEIMQRLDPPAGDDETVDDMLARERLAGDDDAQRLMTDEGRKTMMQEARDFVDKLLAEDEGEES